MEPVISFQNFSFTYAGLKNPTITSIDLDIYPGQKILIAGPSGSGKSTLARCINGLIPHSFHGTRTGIVTVKGVPTHEQTIAHLSDTIGTILQDPEGQFVGLSVGEDVAFAMENKNMPVTEMQKVARQALTQVNMAGFEPRSPHELSGGQKQKVALAGILAMTPEVLLFDEPLANLDPQSGVQMMTLIDEIHRTSNKTMIIVEHRIEDVLAIGVDRIVLMDRGSIVANLSPAEMLSSGRLQQSGVRHPLYLEALERMGMRYTPDTIPLNVASVPQKPTVSAAASWVSQSKVTDCRVTSENLAPLLRVEDVWFSYDNEQPLLQSIQFSVHPGERVALMGHNGAGKSTLSHLLLGILKPQRGEIYFEERPTKHWPVSEFGRRIGYVMQNPHHMISQETVYAEVAFGPRNYGLPESEVEQRVDEALEVCDLKGYKNWPVSALSFGQKKRLTIAAALSMRPKVLLLDEPTAGQDYHHYREVMDFIHQCTTAGIALIMVTHDMHLALEYTDRALVLSNGQLIADAPVARVLADEGVLQRANLQVTSLYRLADHLGIHPVESFIQRFIDSEKEIRSRELP